VLDTSSSRRAPAGGAGSRSGRHRTTRSSRTERSPQRPDRAAAARYEPRRAEDTVLHKIVAEHLEEFIAHAEENYDRPLPRYVISELRGFLKCGRLEEGFIRCHCDGCGADLLVPYSCGSRSICPSCSTRRMCNTAAHLVDRVLPNLPLRQWVATIPYELRPLAAAKPDVLAAIARIFVEAVLREQKREGGEPKAEGGAVCFVHRAGGSLNLSPHFHVLALDGLVHHAGDELCFDEALPPSPEMLDRVVHTLRKRVLGWLARHGYIEEREREDRSNEVAEPTALEGCAQIAFAKGTFAHLGDSDARSADADESRAYEPKRRGRYTVELEGFNMNAGVSVDADNDVGREKIARYCSRPSISLERLSLLDDGRVAYRVRHSRRGETHRLMEPLEFMARLAALVPPPRHALTKYFGVLSSHSKWRALIVPRLACTFGQAHAKPSAGCKHAHQPDTGSRGKAGSPESFVHGQQQRGPVAGDARQPLAGCLSLANSTPSGTSMPADQLPAVGAASPMVESHPFNMITVKHLERLLGGELLALGPRVDWARLLRRTFGFDPLLCPHCGHRLRPIADISERETIDRILQAVGYERRTGPRARAPARTTGQAELPPN
jgi:hypothetical protein